jgi:PHD/YefM family antitoxin component YafN of YafNO toxin-antitoxin module
MVEISSAEVARNFSQIREQAETEPVFVLHYNKPSVVIIAASEFERLKRRDKKAMSIEEMPDWLVELVATARMDAKHAHLDGVKAPEGFEIDDDSGSRNRADY